MSLGQILKTYLIFHYLPETGGASGLNTGTTTKYLVCFYESEQTYPMKYFNYILIFIKKDFL